MAVDQISPKKSETIANDSTPEKSEPKESSLSPVMSRYGRTRKPKVSVDFISTNKNINNFLTSKSTAAPAAVNIKAVSSTSKVKHILSSSKKKSSPKQKSVKTNSKNTNLDKKKYFFHAEFIAPKKQNLCVYFDESKPDVPLNDSSVFQTDEVGTHKNYKDLDSKITEEEKPTFEVDNLMLKKFRSSGRIKTQSGEITLSRENNAIVETCDVNILDVPKTSINAKSGPDGQTPKKIPYSKSTEIVLNLHSSEALQMPAGVSDIENSSGCSEMNLGTSSLVTNWIVGDILWGSVGKFPYWPCLVMTDPSSNNHCILKGKTNSFGKWYFTQFCGDNGRHSWLYNKNLLEFESKQQFFDMKEEFLKEGRRKLPILHKYTLKPNLIEYWHKAAAEAEYLKTLTREQRITFFQKLYPLPEFKKPKKESSIQTESLVDNAQESSLQSTSQAEKQVLDETTQISEEQKPEEKSEFFKEKELKPKKKSTKNICKFNYKTSKQKHPLKLNVKKNQVLPLKKSLKLKKIFLETQKVKRVYRKKNQLGSMKNEGNHRVKRTYRKRNRSVLNDHVDTAAIKKKKSSTEKTNEKKDEACSVSTQEKSKIESKEGIESSHLKEKSNSIEGENKKTKKNDEKNLIKRKWKKKRELGPDFDMYCSKNFDRVADDNPNLTEKEIEKYLQKLWLDMDDVQKLKYKTRFTAQENESCSGDDNIESFLCEENETVTSDCGSSIEESVKPSPPPLADSISKLKKGINLFRGCKNEKVCMLCEISGETIKCRFCHGYFHKACVERQKLDLTVDKHITETSKNGKSTEPNQSANTNEILKSEDKNVANEEGFLEKKESERCIKLMTKSKNISSRKELKSDIQSKESVGNQFYCLNCTLKVVPVCFECGLDVEPKTNERERYRCHINFCGRYYHSTCLSKWPQAVINSGSIKRKDAVTGQMTDKVLTCPQHICHTCVSDNPSVVKEKSMHEKIIVKCIKCPTAYHSGNYCVPAGSEILTTSQILCPRHYKPPRGKTSHVNASWCFICASGGDLICCDLCPTSFHANCLNLTPEEYEDGYTCEDCQTGRFPLFGEVVWVKLGAYRWWPAQILFPNEIPENILNLPHVQGEFAVKFFGSNNYYWINRGRAFLYQEGDSGGKMRDKKTYVDSAFVKALSEASVAHEQWSIAKAVREEGARQVMKPPHYVKIKVNRPVGNSKQVELNTSGLTACDCDPKSTNPCGTDNDCLNRMLMVECNPMVCKASDRCNNQRFEKRLYPPLEPFRTEKRGWGLRTLIPLKKGDFVIEYVGEIIDEKEYKRRVEQMKRNNDENFYFLTIDKDRMLDAGPKGNVARFMNHSCDPNCETQKWTVNGDTRVGLFALKDIPQNSELVFNYNLDTGTAEKQSCLCGAASCRGYIGAKKVNKVSNDANSTSIKATKLIKSTKRGKENKKERSSRTFHVVEDESCFICGEGGEVIVCDNKKCPRVYHLDCLGKKTHPKGKWLCPWHTCDICGKRKVLQCGSCVSSFCEEHKNGNIKLHPDRGLCCKKHFSDEEVTAAISTPNKNVSLTILLPDNESQVLISTPKNETSSFSILSGDLGTPISDLQSNSKLTESSRTSTKSQQKRVRCNLNFETEKSTPLKRERLSPKNVELMDLVAEKVENSRLSLNKSSSTRVSEKVLTGKLRILNQFSTNKIDLNLTRPLPAVTPKNNKRKRIPKSASPPKTEQICGSPFSSENSVFNEECEQRAIMKMHSNLSPEHIKNSSLNSLAINAPMSFKRRGGRPLKLKANVSYNGNQGIDSNEPTEDEKETCPKQMYSVAEINEIIGIIVSPNQFSEQQKFTQKLGLSEIQNNKEMTSNSTGLFLNKKIEDQPLILNSRVSNLVLHQDIDENNHASAFKETEEMKNISIGFFSNNLKIHDKIVNESNSDIFCFQATEQSAENSNASIIKNLARTKSEMNEANHFQLSVNPIIAKICFPTQCSKLDSEILCDSDSDSCVEKPAKPSNGLSNDSENTNNLNLTSALCSKTVKTATKVKNEGMPVKNFMKNLIYPSSSAESDLPSDSKKLKNTSQTFASPNVSVLEPLNYITDPRPLEVFNQSFGKTALSPTLILTKELLNRKEKLPNANSPPPNLSPTVLVDNNLCAKIDDKQSDKNICISNEGPGKTSHVYVKCGNLNSDVNSIAPDKISANQESFSKSSASFMKVTSLLKLENCLNDIESKESISFSRKEMLLESEKSFLDGHLEKTNTNENSGSNSCTIFSDRSLSSSYIPPPLEAASFSVYLNHSKKTIFDKEKSSSEKENQIAPKRKLICLEDASLQISSKKMNV